MFILAATAHLYRIVRQPGRALSAERPHGLYSPPSIGMDAPLDPATIGAPQGTRYQLLRALRAMAKGEAMVVEQEIPSLNGHFESASKRETWFLSLRNSASWEDEQSMRPLLVPGTSFPNVVGRILLRAGWCAPSDEPHWVPNLRFFYLTEIGYRSFRGAQAWWIGLSLQERMRLIFTE
ncbi:MAG: hypothetical protein WC023_05975 [Rhodocyclaceae bacterium]